MACGRRRADTRGLHCSDCLFDCFESASGLERYGQAQLHSGSGAGLHACVFLFLQRVVVYGSMQAVYLAGKPQPVCPFRQQVCAALQKAVSARSPFSVFRHMRSPGFFMLRRDEPAFYAVFVMRGRHACRARMYVQECFLFVNRAWRTVVDRVPAVVIFYIKLIWLIVICAVFCAVQDDTVYT